MTAAQSRPASSENQEEVVSCNASGQKRSLCSRRSCCDWQLLLPRMGSIAVSHSSQTSICISQVPVKKIECVFEKGGLTWTKLYECKICGLPASSIFIGPEPLSEVSHPKCRTLHRKHGLLKWASRLKVNKPTDKMCWLTSCAKTFICGGTDFINQWTAQLQQNEWFTAFSHFTFSAHEAENSGQTHRRLKLERLT